MKTSWVGGMVCGAVLGAACAGGCASSAGAPRMRLGSLPFPGVFSLYEEANPDDMGVHCAGTTLARIGQKGERERGTLYTRRAGFIDVSHMRESIDWVRYLYTNLSTVLSKAGDGAGEGDGTPRFAFRYCEGSFEVVVHRPAWWGEMSAEERDALIEEASIRLAQRMSVAVTTWHEIATWYGHQTIPGISERGSSFTWDDGTAHIVGAVIGASALRRNESDWDYAVTHAIDDELWDLQVLPKKDQRHAASVAAQRWSKGGVAIRRDLEVGLRDSRKTGWLIEELGSDPVAIELPGLADVFGKDCSGLVEVRLTPSGSIRRKLWRGLAEGGAGPETLLGEADLLLAVEQVRAEMGKKWGEGFDRP